jgi:glycosyltransferase involved in cell wall biosynthesis
MITGVVAYRYDYYPYKRNIVDIIQGIEYRKAKDLFARLNAGARFVNHLSQRELISTFDLNNQYFDFNLNRVDLLHLFNGISYGRIPWVSTFETILPRFRSLIQRTHGSSPVHDQHTYPRRAFDCLAGGACKQLIALSESTAYMQRALLADFSNYQEIVGAKIVVMHPPQDAFVDRFEDKQIDLNGRLKFMLVGNSFFRKGGREVIETLKKLRDQYHEDLELVIVSSLRDDGYAVPVSEADVKYVREFIAANQTWVTHYPQLPNPKVLELMKKTHVGLLPSYAETYGYSVLEFQAAGCPVITTNIRAMPEINNDTRGWMIEVPKNSLGEAIYTTQSDRSIISEAIRDGLESAVGAIMADRSILLAKSNASIAGIKMEHSHEEFSARMKTIYLNAIQ